VSGLRAFYLVGTLFPRNIDDAWSKPHQIHSSSLCIQLEQGIPQLPLRVKGSVPGIEPGMDGLSVLGHGVHHCNLVSFVTTFTPALGSGLKSVQFVPHTHCDSCVIH
jgi:hypothetical protein